MTVLFPFKTLVCRPWRTLGAVCTVALAGGCGGGGGGDTASTSNTEQPAAAAVVTFFRNLALNFDFDWATAQNVATAVNLGRESGQALGGDVRVQVSNFMCAHPDVGALTSPMAIDSIVSVALTPSEAASSRLQLELGQVVLPAATSQVLVEVLEGNSVLYSKRHSLLGFSQLNLSFPDSAPSADDARYMDTCS